MTKVSKAQIKRDANAVLGFLQRQWPTGHTMDSIRLHGGEIPAEVLESLVTKGKVTVTNVKGGSGPDQLHLCDRLTYHYNGPNET